MGMFGGDVVQVRGSGCEGSCRSRASKRGPMLAVLLQEPSHLQAALSRHAKFAGQQAPVSSFKYCARHAQLDYGG